MKTKNRSYALLICLIMLIVVWVATIMYHFIPDILSILFGFVVGWGLRDSLEGEIEEE